MFIDIGEGWHLNLAHVARVHVVDLGGAGTSFKFYSPTNDHLGDFKPTNPADLQRVLGLIESFGKTRRSE